MPRRTQQTREATYRPRRSTSSRRAPKRKQPGCFKKIVLAVLVIIALIIINSALHRDDGEELGTLGEFARSFNSTATPDYNWENLYSDNGKYAYYDDDNQKVSHFGIDVSDVQGYIDWNRVAGEGVEFAIIRCGYRGWDEGIIRPDECFSQNIEGASAAGIDTGIYFYSQALNEEEAREEAKFCLESLNGRALKYPISYDFEKTSDGSGRADGLDAEQVSKNAEAFCNVIKEAGYDTIIYGNQHDLDMYTRDFLNQHGTWYAEYDSIPTSNHSFSLWQYTNNGSIPGIDTVVDMDIDLSDVE